MTLLPIIQTGSDHHRIEDAIFKAYVPSDYPYVSITSIQRQYVPAKPTRAESCTQMYIHLVFAFKGQQSHLMFPDALGQ